MSGSRPIEPRLRELLAGITVLRFLVVIWAVSVVAVDARSGVLSHRTLATALLTLVVCWTAAGALWLLHQPQRLTLKPTLAIDVLLAMAVAGADWYVYEGGRPQSFGSAWPATSVVLVAVVTGWRAGLTTGLVVSVSNAAAAVGFGRFDGRAVALAGNMVLLATTGAVAGWVSTRLLAAESEVAAARERERFARSLHDGVLQTLAVIQRRSDDPSLIELARDQENDLRRFIGAAPRASGDLVSELRLVAARVERLHRVPVDIVAIEVPGLSAEVAEALVGATAEAVTNAARHGSPTRVTVCLDSADPEPGARISIVDDGHGFDPDRTEEGTGLSRSIRGRMVEMGGRVEIRSAEGRGTEVSLWVP